MSSRDYDASAFPYKLKQKREWRDLTQQELADLAGLAASQISNFECGERTPSLKNLVKLCLALGCAPNDLLTP